jgi:hypothetical protein
MGVIQNRTVFVWTAAAVAAVAASVGVYLSQDVIDWPLTFSAASDVAQIAALIVGGAWALNRFGVTRVSRSFLEMSVAAKVVGGGGDRLLVEVTVRLKNLGGSRIDARTGHQEGKFLYDDGWDQCEHAGTLKVRAVPEKPVPVIFDWYGLEPLAATLILSAPHVTPSQIAPSSPWLIGPF